MDLHKYTGIPSVQEGCGAGGGRFKETQSPDAEKNLAFQKKYPLPVAPA